MLRDWFSGQEDSQSQERAETLTDELVQHYISEAEQCLATYRFVGAIAAYREALRIDEREEVRVALQTAVDRQVKLENRRALANRLLGEGKFSEAVPTLREILQSKPDDAVAHGRLGTALAQMGQVEEAKLHWSVVAEHDPNDAYGIGMLAWLARREQRNDEAEKLYQAALAIEPYEAKIYYQLGMIAALDGRVDESLPLFERALSIEPLHAQALLAINSALRKLERPQDAIAHAKTMVAITQNQDLNALMILAETASESREFELAIASADQAQILAVEYDPPLLPSIKQRLQQYRNAMSGNSEP